MHWPCDTSYELIMDGTRLVLCVDVLTCAVASMFAMLLRARFTPTEYCFNNELDPS